MAVQGKVFHGLCRLLWRVNASGTREQKHLLAGSAPCWFQRWVSSSTQHPSAPASLASSLQPSFHTTEASLSVSHRLGTSVGVIRHERLKKGVDNTLDVCTKMAGLGLYGHDASLWASGKRGWDLASWPSTQHLEYVCPSEKLSTLPQLVILEQLPQAVPCTLPHPPTLLPLIIDPTTNSAPISEPDTTSTNTPKEARQIMKIRRKKMKRHLLKKFRKRMAFTLRKIKRDRRKKKEAVFQARLAGIKEWGESFSARDWVQDQLDRARKGGFYINILEKRR